MPTFSKRIRGGLPFFGHFCKSPPFLKPRGLCVGGLRYFHSLDPSSGCTFSSLFRVCPCTIFNWSPHIWRRTVCFLTPFPKGTKWLNYFFLLRNTAAQVKDSRLSYLFLARSVLQWGVPLSRVEWTFPEPWFWSKSPRFVLSIFSHPPAIAGYFSPVVRTSFLWDRSTPSTPGGSFCQKL